jgi:heme/copper-type cytochrome/quinol oxidase subunit 2
MILTIIIWAIIIAFVLVVLFYLWLCYMDWQYRRRKINNSLDNLFDQEESRE